MKKAFDMAKGAVRLLAADWRGCERRDLAVRLWFGLSFCLVFILAETWLVFPAIANFALSASVAVHNLDIEDE